MEFYFIKQSKVLASKVLQKQRGVLLVTVCLTIQHLFPAQPVFNSDIRDLIASANGERQYTFYLMKKKMHPRYWVRLTNFNISPFVS